MNELKFLEEQGVSSSLINKIVKFREVYPVSDEVKNRIIKPAIPFYGKDILEMAIAGILQGQNLLLTGPKATGKNILAENLAYIFNRPSYLESLMRSIWQKMMQSLFFMQRWTIGVPLMFRDMTRSIFILQQDLSVR